MYPFRGVLFGFDGEKTVDFDAARLRNHLEAFATDNVLLFDVFRSGTGQRLPRLDQSEIFYADPGLRDPEVYDAAVAFMRRKGACATLSAYMVGWYRYHGEHATFVLNWEDLGTLLIDGQPKRVSRWHIRTRRESGQIEDWSRLRGML
jgi:hypothetical protein